MTTDKPVVRLRPLFENLLRQTTRTMGNECAPRAFLATPDGRDFLDALSEEERADVAYFVPIHEAGMKLSR